MQIDHEIAGDVCVVTAQGRLDGSTSGIFAEQLDQLIAGGKSKLLVDLGGIDFVTSAGLRAVLSVVKKVKAAQGVLAVCGVRSEVQDVLDITGLTPMMRIYPQRSDGLVALAT